MRSVAAAAMSSSFEERLIQLDEHASRIAMSGTKHGGGIVSSEALSYLEMLPVDVLLRILLSDDPIVTIGDPDLFSSLSTKIRDTVTHAISLDRAFWRRFVHACFPLVTDLPPDAAYYVRIGRLRDEFDAWRLVAARLITAVPHFRLHYSQPITAGSVAMTSVQPPFQQDTVETCSSYLQERHIVFQEVAQNLVGRRRTLVTFGDGQSFASPMPEVAPKGIFSFFHIELGGGKMGWHHAQTVNMITEVRYMPRKITFGDFYRLFSDSSFLRGLPPLGAAAAARHYTFKFVATTPDYEHSAPLTLHGGDKVRDLFDYAARNYAGERQNVKIEVSAERQGLVDRNRLAMLGGTLSKTMIRSDNPVLEHLIADFFVDTSVIGPRLVRRTDLFYQ